MKRKFRNIFAISLVSFLVLLSCGNVFAVQQSDGQNIGVTIDNSLVVVPDTPTIIRSENLTVNSLDIIVEVGSGYAGETLDFIVTITNTSTGDVTNANYTQDTNTSARTSLAVAGLNPGTEYQFVVQYARSGGVYSANSAPHSATTLIDAPVLDSVDGVTADVADLHVIVDPSFIGSAMDFVVEVNGGSTYIVQMTQNIIGSSVTLQVDDLDADTDYTFKVKYAREGTLNFSTYSNEKSITTDGGGLEKPVIDNISNVTTTSMDLIVEVEDLGGEDLDFVVHVTNKATGDTFTVDFSETVGGDDTVTLGIEGLDPGTEYEFSVKYARDGESEYSDYSDLMSDHTEYVDNDEPSDEIAGSGENVNDMDDKLSGGSIDKTDEGDGNDKDIEEERTSVRETIIPEEKKSIYRSVATVGAVAGTVAVLAGSAVPLFVAMPGAFGNSIFLHFLELFGVIGRRKEERSWGVVFDNQTRMPIPAVKIVLLDQMGKEMATTYSDKDGRFGFLVNPGTYLINVFKKDYTLSTNIANDELYGNTYDGKNVIVNEDGVMLTNIAMRAEGIDWLEYADKKVKQYNSKWSVLKKYLFASIYFIGFGATIIVTFFYPSVFNFVVLGIYIILFIYQKFFKKKKYGVIKTNDGNPIPFAVVNLYDKDSNKKKKFAVTDPIGRYYLLSDNGKYDLKAKGQPISGAQFEKSSDVHVKDGIVRKDIIV